MKKIVDECDMIEMLESSLTNKKSEIKILKIELYKANYEKKRKDEKGMDVNCCKFVI